MNSESQEEVRSAISTPSLSDSLSQQIHIQELNKKLLNLEQEKERYKVDLEGVKLFFAEELQITDDKSMSLSEMKARFRGYRRREEERDEARIMEHNRTASELFTTVKQNMRLYEKRISDVVSGLIEEAKSEGGVSDRLQRIEEMLQGLTLQKEAHLSTNALVEDRDKDMQISELMESNKRLVERVHVLEEIQKAYRNDSGSVHEEEQIDLCTLQQELRQRDAEIERLQKRLSSELGESERIRKQQHQQLLLIMGNSEKEKEGVDTESLQLQLRRIREDQKQTAIDMASLTNKNEALDRHVKDLEEQLDVLEKRYNVCHKERDELNEKLIESEKFHGTVMGILNEMVDEWDENDP
ncbi:hypothetical protein JH06_5077 [Blastocystis sp. subtype 4]|uniref:hypothetical protein n=1 Tax=Blastocystis sp. subtype 4 TaxID=944170 RepID=UPI000711D5F4|nr:hypothetical protein JH06_5077 [Blastocystis sp. subtype 4]KNB44259.1 hypothetical protein JH06_5077 [Blastocystis sp. subtype 4]|eukprot:XP_014527702.1 hypothetical protein JH06_5077 [Blastocystis sp. subtype 4]